MTIQVFRPSFNQDDVAAVARAMESGWVGKGPKVAEFEVAWANHIGVAHENVVSVNCATEGLFQVCELLSVAFETQEIIIPSIHFIGAANAVVSAGLDSIFCDVDKRTLNPTLEMIEGQYTKYTRGVILLHYGGVAQELDTIRQWCDHKGLWLIEDAANAPVTVYKGKAAGTWGHFGVWSFDAMKIMSTGDGGMIYCENPDHARELRKRLYLGQDTISGLASKERRWWKVESSYSGRRAVMNDLAAGIGLEQLKKLDEFVSTRSFICTDYDARFSTHLEGNLTLPPYDEYGSFYFYWIQTPRRDELAHYLRENGIYTTFRYYPLHWTFKTGQSLPGAEYAAENTLLLPLHQGLSDANIEFICEKVREFYDS